MRNGFIAYNLAAIMVPVGSSYCWNARLGESVEVFTIFPVHISNFIAPFP